MCLLSNKNYVKGRNFEYRTQNFLRKIGYYTIRSYGSKGLYDLIAVPRRTIAKYKYPKLPLLIQCKYNGYVPPKEKKNLLTMTSGRESLSSQAQIMESWYSKILVEL